jgi:hypothetical protein
MQAQQRFSVNKQEDQVVPRRTSSTETEAQQPDIAPSGTMAATLVAALNVTRYHAGVQASRQTQLMHGAVGDERLVRQRTDIPQALDLP